MPDDPWRPIGELVPIPDGWEATGFLPVGKGPIDPIDLDEDLAQIRSPDGVTIDFGYYDRYRGLLVIRRDWKNPAEVFDTQDPKQLVEWARRVLSTHTASPPGR